jgi:hypothetical protein
MRAGRRTPLAASAAAVGVACAVSPLLTWLTANGHKGHCGWTCYVPASRPISIASLGGRGGVQVAPLVGILLVVLALLAAAALVGTLRSPDGPPVALGWTISAVGLGVLIGTVVVIVRYAEGGTMVQTSGDGVFSANPGPGAVVALAATAGAVLLGAAIVLRTPASEAAPTAEVLSEPADDERTAERLETAGPESPGVRTGLRRGYPSRSRS